MLVALPNFLTLGTAFFSVLAIRQFRNEKRAGGEIRPASVSGIVTVGVPVSQLANFYLCPQ